MDGESFFPEAFARRIEEQLGTRQARLLLDALDGDPVVSVRYNPYKTTSKPALEPVPWSRYGFYLTERPSFTLDPSLHGGAYYVQEASSMFLEAVFGAIADSEAPLRILDLCAAPGGKTTLLSSLAGPESLIVANEPVRARAAVLSDNVRRWGIGNVVVTSADPARFAPFGHYFDLILVDAPCSGEGMFRKDADMVKSWAERGPEYYVPIQREILLDAADMLRPGGRMLYSTCTFDREENEGNVEWLLKERPELHLAELPEDLYTGFSGGIGLAGCVRLFPHRLKGEGHFIAILEKDGNERNEAAARTAAGKRLHNTGKKGKLDLENFPEAAEFLSRISWDWDPGRIMAKNDALYYLPEGFPEPAAGRTGVRYLRTGLLLGTVKKGRFEPSQALAMALKPEEFDQVFNLSLDDGRAIRYLKGETIAADAPAKGWYFVCVDGFPLGFAKGNGATLKNKYYPGWRWQ